MDGGDGLRFAIYLYLLQQLLFAVSVGRSRTLRLEPISGRSRVLKLWKGHYHMPLGAILEHRSALSCASPLVQEQDGEAA